MGLVGAHIDLAVQQSGDAVNLVHSHGREGDGREAAQRGVGVLHKRFPIEAVGLYIKVAAIDTAMHLDASLVVEMERAEVGMRCGSIVGFYVLIDRHLADAVGVVVALLNEAIGTSEMEGEIDTLLVISRICGIGYVLLVEHIVTLGAEGTDDAIALRREQVACERRATAEEGVESVGQDIRTHAVVVESVGKAVDVIARARMERVVDARLTASGERINVDFAVEVAVGLERALQTLAGNLRERGAVANGGFAQATDEAIPAFGAVAARHIIETQRHLEEAKPFGVGFLSDIDAVVAGFDVLVVTLELHLLQDGLSLGHVLCGRTTCREEEQEQGDQQTYYDLSAPPMEGSGQVRGI